MNFSSLSGLLVCAAAVIWVVLFIPSWFHSSQNREEDRQLRRSEKIEVRKIRQQVKPVSQTKIQTQASELFRISSIRKVAGLVLSASLLVTVWAAFNIAANWFVLAVAVVVDVLAAVVNRRTKFLREQLLAQSLRNRAGITSRRSGYTGAISPEAYRSLADDTRSWVPVELPKPMHLLNREGVLEEPILAQVSELPTAAKAETKPQLRVEGNSLDEILRRRRAI